MAGLRTILRIADETLMRLLRRELRLHQQSLRYTTRLDFCAADWQGEQHVPDHPETHDRLSDSC